MRSTAQQVRSAAPPGRGRQPPSGPDRCRPIGPAARHVGQTPVLPPGIARAINRIFNGFALRFARLGAARRGM